MRVEEFRMERDVLEEGAVVDITESRLPLSYYYTAVPAVAMSGNFPPSERILSLKGTVVKKVKEGSHFTLSIAFDE